MLENPLPYNAPDEKLTAFNNGQVSVRLLIVHNQMGTIIGKQGWTAQKNMYFHTDWRKGLK